MQTHTLQQPGQEVRLCDIGLKGQILVGLSPPPLGWIAPPSLSPWPLLSTQNQQDAKYVLKLVTGDTLPPQGHICPTVKLSCSCVCL